MGFEPNTEKFNQYAKDTTKLFVKEYPLFYMPDSFHYILVHEANIVDGAILYIGHLSEETQEFRNKDPKYFRKSRSRETSQSSTNEKSF